MPVSNEWEEAVSEQKKLHHGYRLPAQPDSPPSHTERKNSGTGIASFVISIIAGVPIFMIFVTVVLLVANSPDFSFQGPYPGLPLGLFMYPGIGLLMVDFVALALGIWSLSKKEKIQTLAYWGLACSSAGMLAVVVVFVVLRWAAS